MAGIIDKAVNTATAAANYVSETISGNSAEAKATVNEQTIKSDQTSLGQKASAAGEWIGNKSDEHSSKSKAELHKQEVKHS